MEIKKRTLVLIKTRRGSITGLAVVTDKLRDDAFQLKNVENCPIFTPFASNELIPLIQNVTSVEQAFRAHFRKIINRLRDSES